MVYIGLSNYASNTLLNDSDWCNGICNSTYFESVLNVKVPTMTSNTTPSGTCFGTSIDSATALYRAFDGNSNTDVYSVSTANVGAIGYRFTENIYCKKATFTIRNNIASNNATTIKIQGSADNSTWTDLGVLSFTLPNNTSSTYDYSMVLNNANQYDYHRILRTQGLDRLRICNAQFYGRKDV